MQQTSGPAQDLPIRRVLEIVVGDTLWAGVWGDECLPDLGRVGMKCSLSTITDAPALFSGSSLSASGRSRAHRAAGMTIADALAKGRPHRLRPSRRG